MQALIDWGLSGVAGPWTPRHCLESHIERQNKQENANLFEEFLRSASLTFQFKFQLHKISEFLLICKGNFGAKIFRFPHKESLKSEVVCQPHFLLMP